MKSSEHIANTIVRFLKSFIVSIPIGVVLFIVLYFFIYEIQKTFSTDYEVYDIKFREIKDGKKFILSYGIKPYFGSKVYMEMTKNYGAASIPEIRVGSIAMDEQFAKILIERDVRDSIVLYRKEKTKNSLKYGAISIITLPFCYIIILQLWAILIWSIRWINKNRTI